MSPSRSSTRRVAALLLLIMILAIQLPTSPLFVPVPGASKKSVPATTSALRRDLGVGAAAALLGLTVGPQKGQAMNRMPWQPKQKDIYATFTFDMEGEKAEGEDLRQVTVRLNPDWGPRGVKQFLELAESGDFNDATFYHVKRGKSAEFGLPADPLPEYSPIKDDIQMEKNTRGKLAFQQPSFDSRTNQLMFHMQDQPHLDKLGVQPIGEVVGNGMEVIDKIYHGYGSKPIKEYIKQRGNEYLDKEFPKLTKIKSVALSYEAPKTEDQDM